ncbi:hypothetical protein HELRODRAFT_179388 [Helobdella robusta]|uniref:Uncharacterized protein n=1 Tax=Helobdella robusta TaxID=6412 RepID=T1FEN1_HELRO|nr:hypothetical protein HELRODRAFT_179388 [Helobdella robusta]ESN95325.1 hypothetical protein HELRODRAFT_179388 [Helobdella robusta]
MFTVEKHVEMTTNHQQQTHISLNSCNNNNNNKNNNKNNKNNKRILNNEEGLARACSLALERNERDPGMPGHVLFILFRQIISTVGSLQGVSLLPMKTLKPKKESGKCINLTRYNS